MEKEIKNTHSHITGLGFDENGLITDKEGIVGQNKSRKHLYTLRHLATNSESSGVLLQGDISKSALIHAFIKSTRKNAYFCHASMIHTPEHLLQCIRRAIKIKIKEKNTVIQGEVIDIKVDRICLKTVDMESEFTVGRKMIGELLKEKIVVGDVIRFVKETGKVRKLGKSFVKAEEYDALGPDVQLISCPEGEMIATVDNETVISLHQFDSLNNNGTTIFQVSQAPEGVMKQVDNKIQEWVEEGKATLVYDILVIEDIDLLSRVCINHLLSYMNNRSCPFIMGTLCGSKRFLDCSLKKLLQNFYLIKLEKLDKADESEIIKKYAKMHSVSTDSERLLKELEFICDRKGLKHALNLLPVMRGNLECEKSLNEFIAVL